MSDNLTGALELGIALSYFLLGMYLVRRFHPTMTHRNRMILQACFTVFFLGSTVMHFTIALYAFNGEAGWLRSPEMWLAQVSQLAAGLAAYYFVRKHAHLSVNEAAREREIYAAILNAEEMERRRIAGELHDDVVQIMAAALLRLEMAYHRFPDDDLEKSATTLRLAMDRTRNLLFTLRPHTLEREGLNVGLHDLMARDEYNAAEFIIHVDSEHRYDPAVEALIYRTIKEAITNSVKHSECHIVTVVVAEIRDEVSVVVADDGIGFDYPRALSRAGHNGFSLGLLTMQERVKVAGGNIAVTSTKEGTTVRFMVPKVFAKPYAML